jgi:predicted nucleotidyltransferase
MKEGYVTQIGYPPLRIDILNTIDGVTFESAFPNKLLVDVNGLEVKYIGLKDFIVNKTASGRNQEYSRRLIQFNAYLNSTNKNKQRGKAAALIWPSLI